ncbi:orotate phosphoribosyltransferase [Parvularcula maris]|uniref:Orotate phosphoribosyltransferase n=1 Tax=Parvularcula maris TaxID=2965077 RepID=A0A9X2L8Q3_9PROT|nr:orotate phosphoribosyltransferase [Parvularcula maris]MCQ8185036.1 orotate phosphoribosyltransferase [Parvularcula maris]
MNKDEVLRIFEECGALLKGHFILSSGRHADTYLNKALVSRYPEPTERLGRALAEMIGGLKEKPSAVVAPAMGAILFGYETARAMDLPFMYTEREGGEFTFRRGFGLDKGQKVIVVEDIVSTGLSARECVEACQKAGGEVLGVACLIDRSGGKAELGVPLLPLAELDIATYAPDDLPKHLKDTPAVKPGSRGLA